MEGESEGGFAGKECTYLLPLPRMPLFGNEPEIRVLPLLITL